MATLVRAACLTNYAEVAMASGLDPSRMLLDAGLSPSVLSEPDLLIPVSKVGRLLQASAQQSGLESFGLSMARTRLLSNMGPVGLLIRDQETLRDALQVLVRHLTLLNGALSLTVEEDADTVLIRELLLTGKVPSHKIVALGGPGVKAGQAKHYRVRIGATVGHITNGRLVDGETRLIAGDVLGGTATAADRLIPFAESALNVLVEDRERHFLGWITPGFKLFSAHRSVASRWLGGTAREWALGTNKNGGDRAMVLTGLYDQYVDLDLMVDYLVRAVLANDFDEAVKLGLLSVDPEDFALPAFVCPSKMDLVGIVRKGLEDLEKEGI